MTLNKNNVHVQIEPGLPINLNSGCWNVSEYFLPDLLQNTAIKCVDEEVISKGSLSVDCVVGTRVSQKTDP